MSVIFSLLIKVRNSFTYICRILFVISFAFVHTGEQTVISDVRKYSKVG